MSLGPRNSISPLDRLDEVLDGGLGVDAVRQIALEPLRHGLAELVDECQPVGAPGTLELLRTKYKPSRKLTAFYRVRSGDESAGTGQVAVSWFARRSDDERVSVLVSPADSSMPQLFRLSQPARLAALFEELTGRPVESPDLLELHTVRYRPGQRHVLRVEFGDGRPGIFVKTDRQDSGSRAVAVANALGPDLARQCPQVRLAEPVGHSVDDRAALWHHAAGQLFWRLARDSVGAAPLLHVFGRALRVLHDNPQPPSGLGVHGPLDRIGSHDVQAEVASTLRAGEHIVALLPSVGMTYGNLVSEAVERLETWPGEAPTFTHGDVKCDNLLVGDGRIRILDLDRSCWADPALDLGKFLADLRWWWPLDEHRNGLLLSAFRTGYGPCDSARWARANVFAGLFQLKFAARRCAVHDPGWAEQVKAQVARAGVTLTVEQSA